MRWLAIAFVGLAACSIEDGLVRCPDDTLCPVGSVCEPVHGGCALPEQLTACAGVANGESCSAAAVVGYCLDEICIDPGCGNHVVDPFEICDDGNRKDGDGCNATCTSAERCGDGALDRSRNEACDDGNLISHDGCDSRCLVETTEWTVDDLGPTERVAEWTTWDPVHERVVMVTDGFVWGWDGTHWAVLDDKAPIPGGTYDVTFDTKRNVLLVIAAMPPNSDFIDPSPPRDRIWEWNGTTWTFAMLNNPALFDTFPDPAVLVAYDPTLELVFAFGLYEGEPAAAALDLKTHSWSPLPAPTTKIYPENGFGIAYDAKRGHILVVTAGGGADAPAVHEWLDSGWSTTEAPMVASTGWSIAYDGAVEGIVAVGATVGSESPVQQWTGSAWAELPSQKSLRRSPSVVYDAVRKVLVVFGGRIDGPQDDVVELLSGNWTEVAPMAPHAGTTQACAFDESHHRMVCDGPLGGLGGTVQTWVWDHGTWLQGPSQIDATEGALAWDPIRDAVVKWSTTGLFQFVNGTWEELPITGDDGVQPVAMVFDPLGRRLVATMNTLLVGPRKTGALAPDNTLTFFDGPLFSALVFDARNAQVVGLQPDGMAKLADTKWERVVGPGGGYTAVTNARRGTIEFLSPGVHNLERVGAQWLELADLPPRSIFGPAVIDQHEGELHVIGLAGARSRFMMHRRWISATPMETCVPGEDADGDGLAGCEDLDCWTACTPACPPYTTCP